VKLPSTACVCVCVCVCLCVCVCECVCVRVYLLVTTVSPTEMAGLIKVPFVIWIQVGPTVY